MIENIGSRTTTNRATNIRCQKPEKLHLNKPTVIEPGTSCIQRQHQATEVNILN